MQALRELNQQGHLFQAAVACSRANNGWLVEFEKDDGEMLILTKHNGSVKSFDDLDLACDVILSLGFHDINVLE
ncbi:MAG: hypothetical protein HRU20_30555 [Pseudomonadales bacterium]|nr:hypothetical protein [Pseudomonadales bacterium]